MSFDIICDDFVPEVGIMLFRSALPFGEVVVEWQVLCIT